MKQQDFQADDEAGLRPENGRFLKKTTSLIFIFAGTTLMLSSILLEFYVDMKINFVNISVHLLSHVGISCVVIGILGILIDTKQWTEYFQNRLVEIINGKKYLAKLTDDQLNNLETDVLQTLFKDAEISKAGGFLQHYKNNIREIMGSPYRINVFSTHMVSYEDETKQRLRIREEMKWVCKSSNGRIAEEIRYIPEENEFEELVIIEVRFEHESFPVDPKTGKKEIIVPWSSFKEDWKSKHHKGFAMPLTEYCHLDGLRISVKVEFIVLTNRFIAWRMADTSKNVTLTIKYPEDLKMVTEIYCMRSNDATKQDESGYYSWHVDGWILTEEGFAFQFLPLKAGQDLKKGNEKGYEIIGSTDLLAANTEGPRPTEKVS